MSTTAPVPASRPPGPGWYAVAVVIAIAGWIGMGVLIHAALGSIGERMFRLVVPGQAEFRLQQTGTYTIFHEHYSTVDGRVYEAGTLSGLQIIVRFRGSAIELRRPSGRTRYSVGSYSGRSLYQFDVSEPGFYQVGAVYGDGRKAPQTVLAIDHGFVAALVGTILKAFAAGFGGMALAGVIAAVVIVKRRRALRSAGTASRGRKDRAI
jgi:hypothetical protein